MVRIAARSLVLTALAAFPVFAQEIRFHLPSETVDYRIRAPRGYRGCFCGAIPLPAGDEKLPPPPDPTGNERATLGRVLFHDPLLSKNRTTSCASCHRQELGFADDRAKSRGFAGEPTKRNSMSIVDLVDQRGPYFWDGRSATLQHMVLRPIEDPIEMGLDLRDLVARLLREPGYAELFQRAFGTPAVTTDRIAEALATFVHAIATIGSKYDDGLAIARDPRVDFANFTPAENRGKLLFFGTTEGTPSCASCHLRNEGGRNGRRAFDAVSFGSDECLNNGLDDARRAKDPGFGAVTKSDGDRAKFRAPSLRNVEVTAPYMHDGRFATLDDVMEFYARGVKDHPNLDPLLKGGTPSSRDSKPDSTAHGTFTAIGTGLRGFALGSRDRRDLVAFLKTLTDHRLLHDGRFADPFVAPRTPVAATLPSGH